MTSDTLHPFMGAVCWVLPLEKEGEELLDERPRSPLHTFQRGRVATLLSRKSYAKEDGLQPGSPAHLNVCQRVHRVLKELLDTEKSYVKDLVCLFEVYLTPLHNETFLSNDEVCSSSSSSEQVRTSVCLFQMEALVGILPEMLDFQRVFLQTLEDNITSSPDLDSPEQFKKVLLSVGASFLHYADHFKLYSIFCANHVKVQKVLERARTDRTFKHFLDTRNLTKQHSSSLDSFLIKPVQRVLKYPLLLHELISLTRPKSAEHIRLTEALQAMEEVACHINEVKKLYEDFGHVFQQLASDSQVSTGDFLVHSSVLWLNPPPGLGRLKKEPELTLFVFQRAVILAYSDKKMPPSRSPHPDLSRLRWLIPVPALQVIPGWEASCKWQLIHYKSEEGGAREVFQLSSRALESKMQIVTILQNLLADPAPTDSMRRRNQPQSSSRWTSPVDQKDCGWLLNSQVTSVLRSVTRDLEAHLQTLTFSRKTVVTGSCDQRRSRSEVLDLEKDFSVHSITSMTNEDIFYEVLLESSSTAVPALQG
ncbi:rho guanine nucleotide exchange factor TIAM2-like isoform X3 [Entelurus aequoreus]|uniref:rho guanine nucleotide exchange factor TIAM2-like isoform X3 n=1 Tax=Entelurus aequoreus TaxID=161455 RepID=UPI002B1E1815|nr:rho guanine nucleotide exchange factor TIAM2-like isoform X3 [Entelurus aequoreus]